MSLPNIHSLKTPSEARRESLVPLVAIYAIIVKPWISIFFGVFLICHNGVIWLQLKRAVLSHAQDYVNNTTCRTLMRWLFIMVSYESALLPTFIQSAGSMSVVGLVCIADGSNIIRLTYRYISRSRITLSLISGVRRNYISRRHKVLPYFVIN